jgi:glycosyltransferase involved in cell wall biosynthesis/peptidoglycan/xylan/chitin deacetylase (PgdA/CDA1 family)
VTPLVSVVIPTYNHARFLGRALQSVLDQTYPHWEALVIDNHSEDNTDEVMKRFGDPRIQLLKIHNHGVIAASRNLGVREAKGAWIAFLDSDDCWYPKKLETAMAAAEGGPGYDVVVNNELAVNLETGVKKVLRFGPYEKDFYRALLVGGNRLSPSATVVRRSVLVRTDLAFNESPDYVSVEDYDLWLKLALAGARFKFMDDILGEYVLHGQYSLARLSLEFRNCETLLHHHVFAVQHFHASPDRLWRQLLSGLRLAHARRLSVEGHLGFALRLALETLFEFPSGTARFLVARLKKRLRKMWVGTFLPHPVTETVHDTAYSGRVSPYRRGLRWSYRPLQLANAIGRPLGLSSRHRLRVLLYHDVAPRDQATFATQMRWLARDWTFVTPGRFAAMVSGEEPVRGFNLLLTFDDGFASTRAVAEQVLNPMGIGALFFVLSDLVALGDLPEARRFVARQLFPGSVTDELPDHGRMMDWADVEALLEQGHTVGAHTRTHRRVSQIATQAELEHEIIGCADVLERRLGVPMEHFAYPFGDLASFSQTALVVARRRFRFVYSGVRGDNAVGVSPHVLRRDAASARDSKALLGALLEGAADWRYAGARAMLDSWSVSAGEALR